MAKTSRKRPKLDELPAQSDPGAALDGATLLAAARPVLDGLRADLATRAEASPGLTAALTERHAAEQAAQRTADGFTAWREALIAQVAASWFLSCVFVRVLEDRGLLGQARLAGPGALDSQQQFLQLAPSLSERDYLLFGFRELASLPAAAALFDREHALVWTLAPSADAAKELLRLFRTPGADAPAFRFGQADTRFLGDLYQDLYDDVRKRYALLQTPDFVEAFILDRTLEPAIERFGLDDTTLIDPTCGSGHFLLGAFERLYQHRLRAEPGLDPAQAAARALGAVYGADINPYAVAIARFRLTLAYLDKAGTRRLADAPALPLHLVVADSLLHNPHRPQLDLEHRDDQSVTAWRTSDVFRLEDETAARDVLHRQYAAVVGNPPYITEKDSARREVYRAMYVSAGGKYSLAAPFCERFFQLGRAGGFVGQITANSFMKREFGKKLVEEFLPSVNVELIVDASGVELPGHGAGTTVMLFGDPGEARRQNIHVVVCKRKDREPDPSKNAVWTGIVDKWDEVGFENESISVLTVPRTKLGAHPWSLAAGGIARLKALLDERADKRLGDLAEDIGFASFTGLDDAFILPRASAATLGIEPALVRPMIPGEAVRDWAFSTDEVALAPYESATHEPLPLDPGAKWAHYLWPYRTVASNVASFGGKTRAEEGQNWWSWYRWQAERYAAKHRIAFAEVVSHNHFVLDRGGKVFKQTAPIIKLPETATEDDHFALLAYLNSSAACFYLKQVCFNKGSDESIAVEETPKKVVLSVERGATGGAGGNYQFAGTAVGRLPVPADGGLMARLTELGRRADATAAKRQSLMDQALNYALSPSEVQQHDDALLAKLVAIQEEIDWTIYEWLGLVGDATDRTDAIVPFPPGQRPFEVALARRHARPGKLVYGPDGHRIEPATPSLDGEARALTERRIAQLDKVEPFECFASKRRWKPIDAKAKACAALRDAALAHAETRFAGDIERERSLVDWILESQSASAADVAEDSARDLVRADAVPYLAAYRYSAQGLKRWRAWCECWDAQRREDAGESVNPDVPPKYIAKDFAHASYWPLRGKLDVPKERFISYPGCESDEDGEPVYGWAGWDHLQRAQALASLYQTRKDQEGWQADRLTPMLAGLLELIPWLKQWHNEPDPEFGLRMGDYFEQFLDSECQTWSLTRDDLQSWRPSKQRKPKRASKAKPKA